LLGRGLGVNLRIGYVTPDVRSGHDEDLPSSEEVFDDTTAPGIDEQPDFLRTTVQVSLDRRDEPMNPHRGFVLGLGWSRFDDRDGDAFDFDRFSIDARGFLPLLSDQRVLAARAYFSFDEADAGSRVPFYMMETLGGGYSLRGFSGLRFRDENVMALQLEYRWEANEAFEAALFADLAKAVSDRSDLNLDDLVESYGFGLRFKAPTRVFLRLDFAFSNEKSRFLFRLGPSF
jgi:outer membrane protein assembly factor BamA